MNEPVPSKTQVEKKNDQSRFVRWVIASFVLGFCVYAGWKFYQVTVALQVWDGQQIPISDSPKLRPAK